MNKSERAIYDELRADSKFMVACSFVLVPVLLTVAILWTMGMF